MNALLDTNICIQIIRHKPAKVLDRFRQHAIGDLGISSITVAELQYGVEKSQRPAQNRDALNQFMIPLVIVDFDYEAALAYGGIRVDLEARGLPIGSLDLLIAAHAVSRGVTLVTNNTQEFLRVPGLRVEDWTS
jgi:tRNA(fMet)-specific endonuclease VapC